MDEMEKFHTVRGYQLIQQENKPLTSSMEDYIEMIYRSGLDAGLLRTSMLSELLSVHPSSVTKMLQKLSQLGYVDYQKFGIIFLTEKGRIVGKFLYNRHKTLEKFLQFIGNNENPLVETELIEHHISPETLNNFDLFTRFIDENPDISQRFHTFRENMISPPSDA